MMIHDRRKEFRKDTVDKSTSVSNCDRHAEGIETEKNEVDGVFVVIFAQNKQNCMHIQKTCFKTYMYGF